MGFHITHPMGNMEADVAMSKLSELLDELADADDEHSDVAVTHESEWCVSVFRCGNVILEHLEEGASVHMTELQRTDLIQLLVEVASGRIDLAKSRPWKPGYPPRTRRAATATPS